MGRTQKRLWLLIATCGVAGIVLGGTASQAAMKDCLTAEVVTNTCLTQDPLTKTIEGMGAGLFAGVGAAAGITWQMWQKNS